VWEGVAVGVNKVPVGVADGVVVAVEVDVFVGLFVIVLEEVGVQEGVVGGVEKVPVGVAEGVGVAVGVEDGVFTVGNGGGAAGVDVWLVQAWKMVRVRGRPKRTRTQRRFFMEVLSPLSLWTGKRGFSSNNS
jgi:hypothetical protein